MIKKMGLMALGLSMVLLSGCGSSDNDVVTNPTPPVVTPDPTPPGETVAVFTYDLLVGKTYLIVDEEDEVTASFTETEITITEGGETFGLPYTIDAAGAVVIEGNDVHTLISIEGGDLIVTNGGMESIWVLIS